LTKGAAYDPKRTLECAANIDVGGVTIIANVKLLISLVVIAALCLATALANAAENGCEATSAEEHRTDDGAWLIIATDDGYKSPPCVSAGMRHFQFRNRGTKIHEVMFIKLPEEMTAGQYLAAVRSGIDFPEGALDYSGLGLTSPGQQADVWLRLEPGNYLLYCWYKGHSVDLPAHELRVVNDDIADSTPPQADVVVRQVDFRFEIVGEFSRGSQIIRFETPGPSMHEADIFRFNDGMDQNDLTQWYENGREGPAPISGYSGVLDSHDISRSVWVKTDLASGQYILWCNMPMSTEPNLADTNVTHAKLGMTHPFVVH